MSTTNFNVTGFLQTIEQSQAAAHARTNFNNNLNNDKLETVYLSRPENYGRYQIFPMTSTTTGVPMVNLQRTREIKLSRTFTKKDGTATSYDSYVKILPANAYDVMDATGRVTSGLTSAEAELLDTVQRAFDTLWVEMGGNNREDRNKNKTIGFMRRRDYTLFYAKCLQKWGLANPRQAERSNFSALFVCTAKGFINELGENITSTTIDNGDDESWLPQVYSRDLTGRTGYLTFGIQIPEGQIGYKVTIDHKINTQQFANVVISQEDAERMQDPVEGFLGWQASREPGKLFNRELMEETLTAINAKLAAIRSTTAHEVETPMASAGAVPGFSRPSAPTMDPTLNESNPHLDPLDNASKPAWGAPDGFGGNNNPWS